MQFSRMMSAAIAAGAMSLLSLTPVAAAPTMAGAAKPAVSGDVETVRYRHSWHHSYGPSYGYHRYGWRHHGYDRHYGYGGAAIGGLAAGAIIGGAIANSQARAADSVASCAQRFKSYDPASGTYLGYDGRRRSCP